MKARIITGLVGSALALVVFFCPPIVLNIAMSLVCAIAMYEVLIVTKYVGHRGLTAAAVAFALAAPFLFSFGGGMAAAGDILLEPIGRVYNAKVFPPLRGTPILQATLGNEAGITGAVRLVQIEQQA